MKHLCFSVLIAVFLSPIAAKAHKDELKYICAKAYVGDMSVNKALKKLGLKVPKDEKEWKFGPSHKLRKFCEQYAANYPGQFN